ncbi:MAG: FAD-dependent oxidoreductase [Actinocatenispora sp.]
MADGATRDQADGHRPLRVAVIGSGPAGVYAVQALLAADRDISVDVVDRLPTPFGLVRYGVAPDHPKIKSISRVLARVLESPRARFLGNVQYGVDLDAEDLRRHYDAVVHATGCPQDRKMGVPGEDLPGSSPAAMFIDWYNGHPDGPAQFPLTAREVAVVGAGNVALDAARMLVTRPEELGRTDVPDGVLGAYRDNRVTDVYVFARRGPEHAKFTTPELRELADLPDVDLLVDAADLPPEHEDDEDRYDRMVRHNLDTLRSWVDRPRTAAPRRVHLCFWSRPCEIGGDDAVATIQVERTALVDGRVTGTGEYRTVEVQAVLRAVGYGAAPLPGLPFDKATGSIPHVDGRVVGDAEHPLTGVYVAGWIKRGPIGVIGTNKHDAAETVATLLADADTLPPAPRPAPDEVTDLLTARGVRHTSWEGWLRLERHEKQDGERQDRPAVKVADRRTMLDLSSAPADQPPA